MSRNLPTREQMEQNRFLKPIAHRILLPELWRFTRRSVPRGVALGMLAGFLIPAGQIFVAVFMALPVRANVPVAALTTFITNPFTYPFWIIAANKVGDLILQLDASTYGAPLNEQMRSDFGDWLKWLLNEGAETALGFLILAIVFASVSYVITAFFWRIWVARKRRRSMRIKPAD